MQQPKPITCRAYGFSLIEMLVSIAVIVILATITLAGISQSRSRAEQVKCSNNLRHLFTYMMVYAQENDGNLPAAVDMNNGYTWWLNLQEFIGEWRVDIGKDTPLLCPSALETYPRGEARRTYGMNYEGISDWRLPINLYRVTHPAHSLLLVDSARNAPADRGDGYFFFRSPQVAQAAEARHGGYMNALFVDGHIEALSHSDPNIETYLSNITK